MTGICGSANAVGVSRRSLTADRRGAMLVFVSVAMVTLLGFLAMTLDVGAGNRQRRIAQTAADAGAIGGGREIHRLQFDSVTASALNEAVRNGFDAADVTVNYPPASGPYAGNTMYVEVLINKTIPTIFGNLLNVGNLNIATRAVAGVGSYSLTCLYSLDPDDAGALVVDNGGELNTNCGVAVNSTHPNALDVNSSGEFTTEGSSIAIAGGWTGNKTPIPTPSTGTAAVTNPLATLTMPTVGTCTHTGLLTITKDTTLSPGVYCGGIYVDNKVATLTSGTYIMAGGGFRARGGYVYGYGVTIVNTIDPSSVYPFAPIHFGNGCKTQMSAPTSGPLSGVLMFGDPAGPTGVLNTFACASDIPPELTGILYFPTQDFLYDGSNAGTELKGTIIAQHVEVSGKVTITLDTSGSTVIKRMSLVE